MLKYPPNNHFCKVTLRFDTLKLLYKKSETVTLKFIFLKIFIRSLPLKIETVTVNSLLTASKLLLAIKYWLSLMSKSIDYG